jgi:hypothetical protein
LLWLNRSLSDQSNPPCRPNSAQQDVASDPTRSPG